ncbi:MAG TPA: nuclear transport factor 2 family protein [Gemmataceae bacterium]|nr:nuclear transport factor 2 family protein [Gemmataceae bacterium]
MSSATDSAREQLARPFTPELYTQIRRLWIEHSLAEDRRDIPGLLATLAEDCVYDIVPMGRHYEGHAGAAEFYRTFLTAFPDVTFALRDIVIGPQGVFEVAEMTGTHLAEWLGHPGTGRRVRLTVLIHFPWNPTAQKFAGERVYFDRAEFLGTGVGQASV